jgi:predicted ATP-grasp superfamily ATP-dependent carboligase
VRVAALGVDPWEPVRFSRFCTEYFSPRETGDVVAQWLAWLTGARYRGAVLIPCSDDGLELVSRHAARLRALGYVLTHRPELIVPMLDKAATYRLAREAGVPVPRTLVVEQPSDLDPEAAGIGFPCAYKPVVSHRFARHFACKAFIVQTREGLMAAHRRTQAHGLTMMITEIIPGDDDQLVAYVSHLDDGGRPLVEFTHRKLRQWPSGFGLGSYAVSGWDPDVARLALRFLRHVGVSGVSHTEFKRDPRDGVWKLVECNYRFTIEMVGAADDLPVLAYERALGAPGQPLRVRLGSHLWNPIPDVRSFRARRRQGEIRTVDWLRTLRRPLRAHVFRLDDPLPTAGHHVGVALAVGRGRFGRRGEEMPAHAPPPLPPEVVPDPAPPAAAEVMAA